MEEKKKRHPQFDNCGKRKNITHHKTTVRQMTMLYEFRRPCSLFEINNVINMMTDFNFAF